MNMIEVSSLVKQYDRAKEPAVKGIDFSVNEGEFFRIPRSERCRQNHHHFHFDHNTFQDQGRSENRRV